MDIRQIELMVELSQKLIWSVRTKHKPLLDYLAKTPENKIRLQEVAVILGMEKAKWPSTLSSLSSKLLRVGQFAQNDYKMTLIGILTAALLLQYLTDYMGQIKLNLQ